MKVKFGFAFKIMPGNDEKYAILLSQSIRQYCGTHKNSPIYAFIPNIQANNLNPDLTAELDKLDVELIPFDYYSSKQVVCYDIKSIAAGAAEAYAAGKIEQLIYVDVESIFLNDPSLMALNKSRKLGIRPVDIKNIGSVWDYPIDDFWNCLYNIFKVELSNLYPVISTVDSVKLRPYYNACLLTVKPEFGLLQKWSNNLILQRDNPVWKQFWDRDELYLIFLHQAILAGTMLSELCEDDIEQYPVQVNFPLHAYPRHPHKPAWINDLVSCRLELLGADDCWKNWLPMQEPIKSWLTSTVDKLNIDLS